MALRMRSLLLALAFSTTAFAGLGGVNENYRVMHPECPVKVRPRWHEEWRTHAGAIPFGTEVKAIRSQEKPDLVVFQVPGDKSEAFYAASWRCMFAKSADEIEHDSKTYSGWHLSLGLISWQESFSLKVTATSQSYPLKANMIGLCPGNGYLMRRYNFDLGFTGCIVAAKAFVNSEGAIPGFDYSVRNTTVLALLAGPLALWRPDNGATAFGVMLPLMPRLAFWPTPSGTEVGKLIAYLPGFLLEARVERETWSLSQRLGVLGGFSEFVWFFAFNKDFR